MLASNYLDMGTMLPPDQLLVKATGIYNRYHNRWPELKITSKRAEEITRARGYILNGAGRRLHLPGPLHNIQWVYDKKNKEYRKLDRCHVAFNRRIQSFAADLAKERAVDIQPLLREIGAILVALVHDEFLFYVPTNVTEAQLVHNCNRIRSALEQTPFKLRVPIRCDAGYSRRNWADCSSKPYCDISRGVASYTGGGKIDRHNYWLDIELEKSEKKGGLAIA